MRKIIYKIFHPTWMAGLPIFILGFALLIYVFIYHLENEPIAYIAYLLSTYSLILFIIWFIKACKFSSSFIKDTKIYKTYEIHRHTILKVSLLLSSIINLLYGIFKLTSGIYLRSWWFITFAVYYIVLWIMKASLIRDVDHFGEDIKKEYRKLKNVGAILLFLNIILTGMIILILKKGQYFIYPGYLIYAIALYDFYLIIVAIINAFKHINYKSPAVTASKCISLTVAMISILSLEVAMIYQFGNNDTSFKLVMTSCTGFAIVLINSIMAIIMIYKGQKGS